MRSRIGRPSPALVVALVALFFAMGGSGWAANKLSGALIKTKTLSGKALKTHTVTGVKIATKTLTAAKIADNTLTGGQLLESSLGMVPSAQRADSATRAGSATTADSARTAKTADTATTAKTADTAANATNAANATTATNAINASNANALGGVAPSGYMRTGTRTYTAGGANSANFGANEDLVTLALPAGQYAITAKIDIANGDGNADNLTCTLRRDGTVIDTTSFTLGPDSNAATAQTAEQLPIPFVGISSGAAADVTIRCTTDNNNDAANGHIVAVRVD